MNNQYSYYLVYKPYGMLSQFTPEGNKPALGSLHKFPLDCYPVERLDTDSEGLLLLTNDKKINHKFLDSKFKSSRTYLVQVDGDISEEAIKKLSSGVEIKVDGKILKILPAQVEKIEEPSLPPRNPPVRFRKTIPTSWIKMVVSEGKIRQIKPMTAAVGFPTLRLVRSQIEQINIDGMKSGEVVEMTGEEIYSKLF